MKKFASLFLIFALAICAGCGREEMPSVQLFFTADIEGVFWPRPEPRYGNEVTGGLSVLKAFLDKQTEPFLLLDGGNWFAQTPEGTLSQGEYFNVATASIPYSGRLFTDKDLVYGWPSLGAIIQQSPAPFILSNVTLSGGKIPQGVQPWLIEEISGYKIGVFGLLGQEAVKGKKRLGGLKVEEETEAARRTVQLLKEKGVDAVVLVSALGTQSGENAASDVSLAEEVEGIDVILSADLGRENAESERVGKTLIVYPGSKLDSVGRIILFFNKNREVAEVRFEDVVLYRRDFGEDANVSALVEEVRHAARAPMNRPVGTAETTLEGRLDGESALGDWAADCLRTWARADAALINADSLRASLPAGKITQYDLYVLYPYTDNITYLTIKGAALRRALEEGLRVKDNFAQISGLQITYRPSAEEGKRIASVLVGGKALLDKDTYRVAVTDHMLAGGAGHDGFIDSLEFKNTQVEMRTVLRLCLSGKKAAQAPAGGRWKALP